MTAETLRRAVALMRERAEGAVRGPWETSRPFRFYVMDMDGYQFMSTRPNEVPTAEHIASWHPAVALAVADSIEEVLCWFDPEDCTEAEQAIHDALLVTARAYLGESA